MKITIIEQPVNNRGDEAAHRSLVRQLNLEFSNAHITVVFIGENPNSVEQMCVKHPNNRYVNITGKIKGMSRLIPKMLVKYKLFDVALLFPVYRNFIKILKESDIIIISPGGINMGGFETWSHLFYINLALKYNNNVIYYGRSIGPFTEVTKDNRIFKKRSLEILHKLKFISLRDSKSMKTLEKLGISYCPTIDTAFLDVPNVILPKELSGLAGTKYIIFVPNSLTWHPVYRDAQQEIIDDLYISIVKKILENQNDIKIIMLPQLFNSNVNDEQYFKKLKSKINNDKIVVLPETYSSDIQQKIISNSKLVIGARYHSIVFAINNNIPFIALSYEHKMDGLCELLEIDKMCIDITGIGKKDSDSEIILTRIQDVLKEKIHCADKQKAHNIAMKCFKTTITKLK